jgi:hypothetical protein
MNAPQHFSAPSAGWHVADLDLAAYAAGRILGVSADSIEAHLLRCDRCRAGLAASSPRENRDRRWEMIALGIDKPGRWTRRTTWFRIALGTPNLAATGAMLAALFFAVPLIAEQVNERATITWFMALAPSFPIGASLIAYMTAADPAGNASAATPLHSFRLVVLRTAVLLAAVLPVGLLTSVLLPVRATLVLGWFLPAVAVCALVLAVGTRYEPMWVAGSFAVAWAAVVFGGFARLQKVPVTDALERLSVNRPVVQLVSLVVATAAGAWFIACRNDITYRVTP